MRKLWLCLIVLCVSVSLFAADKNFEEKYNLKSIVDDENGIIWYKHKQGTQGAVKIYPYIGRRVDSEQCFLRMVILFYGGENLFVREYVFTVDDEEFVLKPRKTIETVEMRESRTRRDTFETGSESKGIVEIYDVAANPEEVEMMEKISQAKTVKLRYNGVKGFHKVAVHKKTKRAMKDVLDAFKELIGISNPKWDLS